MEMRKTPLHIAFVDKNRRLIREVYSECFLTRNAGIPYIHFIDDLIVDMLDLHDKMPLMFYDVHDDRFNFKVSNIMDISQHPENNPDEIVLEILEIRDDSGDVVEYIHLEPGLWKEDEDGRYRMCDDSVYHLTMDIKVLPMVKNNIIGFEDGAAMTLLSHLINNLTYQYFDRSGYDDEEEEDDDCPGSGDCDDCEFYDDEKECCTCHGCDFEDDCDDEYIEYGAECNGDCESCEDFDCKNTPDDDSECDDCDMDCVTCEGDCCNDDVIEFEDLFKDYSKIDKRGLCEIEDEEIDESFDTHREDRNPSCKHCGCPNKKFCNNETVKKEESKTLKSNHLNINKDQTSKEKTTNIKSNTKNEVINPVDTESLYPKVDILKSDKDKETLETIIDNRISSKHNKLDETKYSDKLNDKVIDCTTMGGKVVNSSVRRYKRRK